MTINYYWYTTNYRHAAAYVTLIIEATVYNKPFMFNIGLKKSVDFFLNFQDNFIISGTVPDKVSKSGTVPDSPGRMACIVAVLCIHMKLYKWINSSFPTLL